MYAGTPALTHEQQQQAVEEIHALMAEGLSSGEAIALVAAALRQNHQGDNVSAMFDDEDDENADQE
ncbi:YoaH family protein [Pectobacteriaceae bacterium CE90]|nr:YoaH family protein [Prodigiosinella sp. LS101]WJV55766.1 YoaH family protein [Prodigiosinella sp. LS101]WJV60128.1 YoaH family protein [Pectobacteriaceae bacterium C111]WJY13169.1 YoaH family protein [Pectobacteriaceae bacterium CE90]